MATKTREVLQNGTTANDGTGDTLRDAADKINTNFTYVWNRLGGKDSYFTDNLTADSDGNLIFTNGVYNSTFGTSTLSGNRDIDLPNASGTVVLKTTTDVLTNKTLTTPVISTVHDSNGNTVLNPLIVSPSDWKRPPTPKASPFRSTSYSAITSASASAAVSKGPVQSVASMYPGADRRP